MSLTRTRSTVELPRNLLPLRFPGAVRSHPGHVKIVGHPSKELQHKSPHRPHERRPMPRSRLVKVGGNMRYFMKERVSGKTVFEPLEVQLYGRPGEYPTKAPTPLFCVNNKYRLPSIRIKCAWKLLREPRPLGSEKLVSFFRAS